VAELTTLETKLGEVTGLAMAAQELTKEVRKLVEDEGGHDDLVRTLEQMREEAAETERRCTEAAEGLNGKKTAVLEKARQTKQEAAEMASTYLGDDADALDGFEFMTMAEAGEVGHWAVVGLLARKAGDTDLHELAEWARPIQQRHFEQTLGGSLELARSEDPSAVA
jgi:hypothetical protein